MGGPRATATDDQLSLSAKVLDLHESLTGDAADVRLKGELKIWLSANTTAQQTDDDFGLSPSDEADLLDVESSVGNGGKRKSDADLSPPPKRQHQEILSTSNELIVATSVLQKRFGMNEFRLKQASAITRLLRGQSSVVVFPTGGGKSLCYQVPALCFKELDRQAGQRQGQAESGITLVVSPLIALMKDQVDALKRRGISAAQLDSTKSKEEYLQIVESMRNGTLDILYCAPERLNNEGFVSNMAHVQGGVRLLAVDEAHCISEWGHAFRPDYLKVARFAKEIEAERVVCLTATATPAVAADICKAFGIDEEGLLRTTTYRPNLKLLARAFETKKQSYPHLTSFLKSHPGPTIVYVTLQKHAEQLAEDLRGSGFNARHFHAGMEAQEKSVCQDAFLASDKMIIVATIAFGMGIDKPNIRNIVNYDIPSSLEEYSQEIGRAGRDGKESYCLLYLCAEDFHLRESFARGDLPSKQSVSKLLYEIFDTTPSDTGNGSLGIESNLYQQAREFDIKQTVLKNIYAQLELRFGLLREATPKYTSYSYRAIASTGTDRSAAAQAVRNHSKPAKSLTHIDVDKAARSSGLQRMDIVSKLNDWHDRALIDLQVSKVVNIYRVFKPLPQAAEDKRKIVNELYTEMEARERQNLSRAQQITDLVTAEDCFARTLAKHFGDDIEGPKCGHCTWCETGKRVQLVERPATPFDLNAFKRVLQAVPARDDARFLARVAFGIGSPRVTQEKLGKHPVFESMASHDFMVLLNAFTKECSKHNQALAE